MKRISNTWQVVVDEDNAMSAIIDGTRFKRGKRGVQKLLFSKEAVAENPGLYHQIDPAKARVYAKQLTTDGKGNEQVWILHGTSVPCYHLKDWLGETLQLALIYRVLYKTIHQHQNSKEDYWVCGKSRGIAKMCVRLKRSAPGTV